MTDVAILGATGYGGVELVRLLQAHPEVRLAFLSSESYAGRPFCDVYPQLAGVETPLQKLDPAAAAKCDFAFLALPAGQSMEIVPDLLAAGARVVDVGPDFRLRDPGLYPRWYEFEHKRPDLLQEAVFGLPELHREAIASARLVAAPGCYTTAALLALAPLAADGLIDPQDIIADGKSGLSGAGRTALKLPYHFPEANEDVSAYALGGHRHMPEMVQELQALAGAEVRLAFTPHLIPMTRGILMTVYLKPRPGVGVEELRASLARRYADEPFVRLLPDGRWPHSKWTQGTNLCFLGLGWEETTGRALLVSALDNLGKGMAGQMVQCFNVMLGVEETSALGLRAVYP